jgi:hypothetical protein
MERCLPRAGNGSWNVVPDNRSAASAARAMTCAIGAASAHAARGRTSCKRQASGSNPLTGSQVREGFGPARAQRWEWTDRNPAESAKPPTTTRQIACTIYGRLAWISDPVNGSRHDNYGLGESGVLLTLDPENWVGDKPPCTSMRRRSPLWFRVLTSPLMSHARCCRWWVSPRRRRLLGSRPAFGVEGR